MHAVQIIHNIGTEDVFKGKALKLYFLSPQAILCCIAIDVTSSLSFRQVLIAWQTYTVELLRHQQTRCNEGRRWETTNISYHSALI
jgi:hypothetical protein